MEACELALQALTSNGSLCVSQLWLRLSQEEVVGQRKTWAPQSRLRSFFLLEGSKSHPLEWSSCKSRRGLTMT